MQPSTPTSYFWKFGVVQEGYMPNMGGVGENFMGRAWRGKLSEKPIFHSRITISNSWWVSAEIWHGRFFFLSFFKKWPPSVLLGSLWKETFTICSLKVMDRCTIWCSLTVCLVLKNSPFKGVISAVRAKQHVWVCLFLLVSGLTAFNQGVNSGSALRVHSWWAQGTIWDAIWDRTWIVCVQGKCPLRCIIAAGPQYLRFISYSFFFLLVSVF